ncbi:MAG: hypothetical protein R3D31_03745 [Hyphomicrobiaceae bacterium]
MGCDVHFYVERLMDGRWETADTWVPRRSGGLEVETSRQFYSARDYDLFAILADVRNRHDFTPIAAPRGVPDDCCEEYRREVALWENSGHSHSWLTLDEMLRFDWTQLCLEHGWVTPWGWFRWLHDGAPDGSLSWIAEGSASRHSNAEFQQALDVLGRERRYPDLRAPSSDYERFVELLGGSNPVTYIEWLVPYHDKVSQFWSATVPRLLALSRSQTFDDVRVLFFFDN